MKRWLLVGVLVVGLSVALPALGSRQNADEVKIKEIYRQSKRLIYQKDWEAAARELRMLTERYSGSLYQDDALYWLGYSLEKLGNSLESLSRQLEYKKDALAALETLQEKFPRSKWVDEAGVLKVEIAEGLVKKGFGEYKKYIVNRAKAGENVELKIVALDALVHMDKEKAFPMLKKMLLKNDDPALRRRSLLVLAQLDDPRVMPLLKTVAVEDGNPEVRHQAIFWIGQRGGVEAIDLLLDLLGDAEDLELKSKIIFSLSQIGGERVAKELLVIAENPREEIDIRKKALFWLGQIKSKDPQKTLGLMIRLYDSIQDRELRERIIFSIAQAGAPGGSEALIALYRKEGDFKLKKRLIMGLQQIGDSRAMEFFKKILEE
jgi:HEAT repeat protein